MSDFPPASTLPSATHLWPSIADDALTAICAFRCATLAETRLKGDRWSTQLAADHLVITAGNLEAYKTLELAKGQA
jgi:hypothetical protein